MSRVVDTFLELARISSPSGREAEVAQFAADALRKAGCDVRFDDTAYLTGSNTGNCIATLPGEGEEVLAFGAHMDCVQPCENVEPVVDGGVVRSAGDTVLGADDKAGIAAIIEAVRRLSEEGIAHRPLKVLLTVREEEGLRGAKALSRHDAECSLFLVLDADGPVGGIVIAAPSQYVFKAMFHGRAAHAGVEPEKGSSAIEMAAHAIARMRLGRLDAATTANIGTIAGGTATNVVAPSCAVTGECRSLDHSRAEEVRSSMDRMMKEAAESYGGTVDVDWNLEYRCFSIPPDGEAVKMVQRACEAIGVEPVTQTTGGGSDANVLSAHGIPALVLATGMMGVHSTDESIETAQLELLTDLIVELARIPGA